MIVKRKWHQIAASPRDEQAGTRLVVPAKAWKWKRLGCRRSTLSGIEREKLYRFRALLPRAVCLTRLCRAFVAFGLTWALVDSVNSFRTVEAQPGVPYYRFSSPAWLTACRENRKPEAPWQCLSYSVKDIDGHVVAVSYRGQERKNAIAGGRPCSAPATRRRPGGAAGLTCRA